MPTRWLVAIVAGELALLALVVGCGLNNACTRFILP
jgi:hypothetical protein